MDFLQIEGPLTWGRFWKSPEWARSSCCCFRLIICLLVSAGRLVPPRIMCGLMFLGRGRKEVPGRRKGVLRGPLGPPALTSSVIWRTRIYVVCLFLLSATFYIKCIFRVPSSCPSPPTLVWSQVLACWVEGTVELKGPGSSAWSLWLQDQAQPPLQLFYSLACSNFCQPEETLGFLKPATNFLTPGKTASCYLESSFSSCYLVWTYFSIDDSLFRKSHMTPWKAELGTSPVPHRTLLSTVLNSEPLESWKDIFLLTSLYSPLACREMLHTEWYCVNVNWINTNVCDFPQVRNPLGQPTKWNLLLISASLRWYQALLC